MFNWLRKRDTRTAGEKFVDLVPEILSRYGELLQEHPLAFMDDAYLPVGKEEMKLAFQVGWKLAEGREKCDEMRETLLVVWQKLRFFQPGLGPEPLDDVSHPAHFARLVEETEAERQAIVADIQDFVGRNP